MARSYAGNEPRRDPTRLQSRRQDVRGALRGNSTMFAVRGRNGQVAAPGSVGHLVGEAKAVNSLAKSSVPPAHLNGLQFVGVTHSPDDIKGDAGRYYPNRRGLVINYATRRDTPLARAYNERALVHEVGHHVQNMQHGMSLRGHAEALAENYADRHASPSQHPYLSAYDGHAAARNGRPFATRTDPTGEFNRRLYSATRGSGVQPYDRAAAW